MEGGWERLQAEVLGLYEERRYGDALGLVRREAPRHPTRAARLSYWEACLLCRSGHPDQAVAALRRASDLGLWWSEFVWEDEDLRPILDHPDVIAIREESERLRGHAVSRTAQRPRVKIMPSAGPPWALVVVLHMYGGDPEATATHWRDLPEAGIAVVLPESTQLGMDATPSWDDPRRSERDVRLAFRQATEELGRHAPLILAGASQGAQRAMQLAFRELPAAAAAFIAIVPAVPDPDELGELAAGSARRDIRGWLITGDRDPGRAEVLRLHHTLTRCGVRCRLDDFPGLGHEYPPDFGTRARAMLDFLLTPRADGQ